MPAPLKNHQKWELVKLARRAFDRMGKDQSGVTSAATDFDSWRHSEVVKACGKNGLRCCDQDDYAPVKAHFLDLVGASGAAFNWQVRAQSQGDRVARAVLERECRAGGLALGYAMTICKRQFHCELNDASEKQLWSLVYTVRNRVLAKKRAEKKKGNDQSGLTSAATEKGQSIWLN